MNRKFLKRALIYLLAIVILWQLLLFLGVDFIEVPPYQRVALARELGIEYNGSSSFPYHYFEEKVELGMSIEEVHEIVRAYEQVYYSGPEEVYYYYNSSDAHALRFKIIYDYDEEKDTFVVSYFGGEDDDSRTIRVQNCEFGRVPE